MIRGGKREGEEENAWIVCSLSLKRSRGNVWVCLVGGGVSERLEHEK